MKRVPSIVGVEHLVLSNLGSVAVVAAAVVPV